MGVQPIKNISASAYTYKNLVESLTKKYGPPSGTSEDNLMANSGWNVVDTDTKDKYTILAMFTKYSYFMDPDYPANAELVGVTVYYSASSLAKWLKDKAYSDVIVEPYATLNIENILSVGRIFT